jgi:hypothetical protein
MRAQPGRQTAVQQTTPTRTHVVDCGNALFRGAASHYLAAMVYCRFIESCVHGGKMSHIKRLAVAVIPSGSTFLVRVRKDEWP